MTNIAILLSGRGSNFVALAEAVSSGEVPGRIVLVVSDKPDAPGIDRARERNLPVRCLPSGGRRRAEYDRELVEELRSVDTEIVCLAGFMRLLSPVFVRAFPNRILNIHPSLLPAFPGLHAQRQALEWGVKVTGCTVHLVDEELDHGPILLQRAVPVVDGDDEESLSSRILREEHRIYPEALRLLCSGRLEVRGRQVSLSS